MATLFSGTTPSGRATYVGTAYTTTDWVMPGEDGTVYFDAEPEPHPFQLLIDQFVRSWLTRQVDPPIPAPPDSPETKALARVARAPKHGGIGPGLLCDPWTNET